LIFDVMPGHAGHISAAVCLPDGITVVSAGSDGQVRYWDSQTGRHRAGMGLSSGFIYDVAVSPDATLIAAASADGVVRVSELQTGRQVHRLSWGGGQKAEGQMPNWQARRVAFSPDGRLLASGHLLPEGPEPDQTDRTAVCLWDLSSAALLATSDIVPGMPGALDFAQGGKEVVCADDRGLRFLDGRTLADQSAVSWGDQGGSRVLAFRLSADLAALSAPMRRGIELRRASTGELVWDAPDPTSAVTALAFSADGRLLAAAAVSLWQEQDPDQPPPERKGWVSVLDTATGQQVCRLDLPGQSQVTALVFLPDGRRLVTGMADSTLIVWDVSSAQAK
jgi:WD40 repeat protein